MSGLADGVISGAMAAAVTPRRENGHTIEMGLALEIIDFINNGGVKGIAVLGATGEFIHYDVEERAKVAQMAVRRSRTPVIVNVSHSTVEGAVTLARAATESGAKALLLMPPHYYRYSQEALLAYFFEFSRQTNGIAPVLLYNIPFFTTPLEAPTACKLLESGRFAGIKDSSGNPGMFAALYELRQRVPFRLLIGNDNLLPTHLSKADGVISGCACGVPELIVGIDRAITLRDDAALERRAALLRTFIERIDAFPTPFGIQLTLSCRGFKKACPRLPIGEAAEQRAAEFRDWFPGFEKAMLDECRADN